MRARRQKRGGRLIRALVRRRPSAPLTNHEPATSLFGERALEVARRAAYFHP
jgi:hypothetical protein